MASGAWGRLFLALVLLVPAPALAAPPPPIVPGQPGAPATFASPHEIAFGTFERLLAGQNRVPSEAGSNAYFTTDQMLAILVELHRASVFPSRSSASLDLAQRLWDAAEAAYNPTGRFYDTTLTARTVCIDTEANAWALEASGRLANATGRADLRSRSQDLAQTLSSALTAGASSGVPRCAASGAPSAGLLPLWTLLLHAEAFNAGSTRSAALSELQRQLDRYYDGGLRDPSGLYLAVANAQLLLVLQSAERASPGQYAARRDEVATLLAERLSVPVESGLRVRNGEKRGDQVAATQEVEPSAQAWAAYALHGQRPSSRLTVVDAPERLLQALVHDAWSTQKGGLASGSGQVQTRPNLLVALFTAGPALTQTSAEGARIALVVPSRAAFPYPGPDAPDARSYLVSNEWTFRFALEPHGPNSQPVLLPLDRVGPVRHAFPVSPYAPLPQLQRAGGTPVIATAEGAEHPLLRFDAVLQPATPYRLVDYAPVLPVASELQRDLRLFLVANATADIPVDLLRLDLAVTNVTINGVRFNDELLPATEFTGSQASPTEQIGYPHIRLELRGVTIRPGMSNEVFVSFVDAEGPRIVEQSLSSDPEGALPLSAGDENRFKVSTKGKTYVSALVQDNAALRSVSLIVSVGVENVTEVPMVASVARPDRFVAALPPLEARREAQIFVQAVDQHGALTRHVPFTVQAQPPFLQAGDPVLLVFAAVLFVGAIVVWAKMGRRKRRA